MRMEWRKSSWILVLLLALSAQIQVVADGPINEKNWDELRKELNYDEEVPQRNQPENSPFLQGFLATLFSGGALLFGSILILVLVATLIYVLAKHSKKIKLPAVERAAEEVLVDELNSASSFENLWQAFNKAKADGNYRECVRLFHQICIKKLSEAELVRVHPEKTNWEYVSELSNNALAPAFSKLTAEHEFIWYGNRYLSGSDFKSLELEFNAFLNAEELGR